MADFGEQLILLLDRMEDMKKPHILARIMSAAAADQIPLVKAMRLAKIVDRIYLEDLSYLVSFTAGLPKNRAAADALFSAGLLTTSGLQMGDSWEETDGGVTTYQLNEYGRLLLKYGLVDTSVEMDL